MSNQQGLISICLAETTSIIAYLLKTARKKLLKMPLISQKRSIFFYFSLAMLDKICYFVIYRLRSLCLPGETAAQKQPSKIGFEI